MKKCAFFCLYTFLSVILVTSCLGDSGNKITISNQPGVVIKTGTDIKIQLKDSNFLYSDKLTSGVDDGDCLLIKYDLDYNLPVNADSGRQSGFYTVDIVSYEGVPLFPLENTLDTVTMHKEIERTISSLQQRHAFIRDRLFLFTDHKVDSLELRNYFDLAYNANSNPESDENYPRIYNTYLRVFRDSTTTEPKAPDPTKTFTNAFNIEQIREKEKRAGYDSIYIKVNYVTSFDKDTTRITNWGNKVFGLSVEPRRN